MAVSPVISLPPFSIPPLIKSKPLYHAIESPNHAPLSILSPPPTHCTHFYRLIPPRATVNRPISAVPDGFFVLAEANPPETSDQIVSAGGGDRVSIIISVLLSIAFVGLSILTIGVIYIAVTDYLQKREKEKFEKEEAEKAKKGGKKKRVRARAGPKGFGQKLEDDDDF